MRRLAPDRVQLQVIVGSLLGAGEIRGAPGARRLAVADTRDAYARWKYERLGALTAEAPVRTGGQTRFATILHPLFDDLADLDRAALQRLADPFGVAVWLADLGRLKLSLEASAPAVRESSVRATRRPRTPAAARAGARGGAPRWRGCAAGLPAPR